MACEKYKYKPKIGFNGSKECFTDNSLEILLNNQINENETE